MAAPWQRGFWLGDMVMPTGCSGLTVTGIWMLDAGLLVVQVALDVRVQETRSPLFGVNVYVKLFVPAVILFRYHWYNGLGPGFVGWAVNVIAAPWQTGF